MGVAALLALSVVGLCEMIVGVLPFGEVAAGTWLRCAFFLEAWISPDGVPLLPTTTSWMVSALILCWLLYPCLLHGFLEKLRSKATVFVPLGVWLLAYVPQLIFGLTSGFLEQEA